ncbi:MAG: hypothetical protein JW727_06100 [Candidatus Aenigmarchaeota archaeon]|nr:hypothetical protein [Candidatus Aenigmarchaeota archaeon]
MAQKLKYPKLLLLCFTFVLAFWIFSSRSMFLVRETLASLGYAGTFLAGVGYAYGFTAAPATAILLVLGKSQNLVIAGLIGGIGALVADLIIFRFVTHSFSDELKMLSEEKVCVRIGSFVPCFLRSHLIILLAIFVMASPLPDEMAVLLFAATGVVSIRTFSMLSFILNTAGIFTVLALGGMI